MWHFYWRSIRRIPSLAVEAVKRVDTFVGLLTICVWVFIGGTAAGAWWQKLPWQVPVTAIIVFLIYGFLRAVYQQHSVVEKERERIEVARREAQDEKERLQKRLTTIEKRVEIKRAMAQAALEGQLLHDNNPTKEQCQSWANRVAVMIWVALGDVGRVRLFYNDFDVPVNAVADDSEAKQAIRRRLKYIHELIPQVDSLNVSPDFNDQVWLGHRPPHIKVPVQAQEVFKRAKEIQEANNPQ
jgi:hypothetical protein